jgi:hypothetical protein
MALPSVFLSLSLSLTHTHTHTLCICAQVEGLRLALEEGADVNARVRQGPTSLLLSTPLHLAGALIFPPLPWRGCIQV